MIRIQYMLAAALISFGVASRPTQAAAPATAQGTITAKGFLNIPGTAVANLTNNTRFPNSPGIISFPPYFERNATGDITTARSSQRR